MFITTATPSLLLYSKTVLSCRKKKSATSIRRQEKTRYLCCCCCCCSEASDAERIASRDRNNLIVDSNLNESSSSSQHNPTHMNHYVTEHVNIDSSDSCEVTTGAAVLATASPGPHGVGDLVVASIDVAKDNAGGGGFSGIVESCL